MTKICTKCKILKNDDEFHKNKYSKSGYLTRCKNCIRERDRISYQKNPSKKRESARKLRNKNPELIKKRKKCYYENNKEKILNTAKEYYLNNKEQHLKKCNEWVKNNKEKSNLIKKRYKNKLRSNPKYKLNESISRSINKVLSYKTSKNNQSWITLVNFSIEDLYKHIESKFTPGMTWDNYGKDGWHLDHVIPKHYFKFNSADHPAFKACWSLDNLQPLWATKAIAISYGEENSYVGNLDKQHRIEITKEIEDFLKTVNV